MAGILLLSPPQIHALLRARERALKGDKKTAKYLREDLAGGEKPI
ncbi:hypothetical protein OIN60_18655 [Paenibacillus sp. P96]|uniref:Cysteinyl-tRNA ligase anticodon binding domain-containing protein n=1 Tax=Paenibacillus zeirhizosphaerae TaxID=2987519 RepID=A0ABT9FW52_9BACL|nr:hypothetical protein [Paenibacillus sp. P96]MDP4098756.1 hypothetical protein [Paenibacillus sp. P96]